MNESRTLDSRPEYRVTQQEPSDEEKTAVYQFGQMPSSGTVPTVHRYEKVSAETESKCVMKGPKE